MTTNRRIVESKSSADFYPTPAWATRALLDNEYFEGNIWECACGTGWMSEVIKEDYSDVMSSDLHARGYGIEGWDFLGSEHTPANVPVANIVTNPPYNLAEDFIDHSLKIASHKVCMLLRLAFLEGSGRYRRLFKERPPTKLLVFSERITFYPDGVQTGGTGTTAYGWFIWDKSFIGQPTMIEWIEPGYKGKSK